MVPPPKKKVKRISLHCRPYRYARVFFGLWALVSIPRQGSAQGKIQLKPSDLVDLSPSASKQVQISEASVEAARARLAQSKDRVLPTAAVSGAYYRFTNPSVTTSQSLKNALNGNKPATTGGSSFPTISEATVLQANVSETIFGGFRNKYTIESDQFLVKAAEMNKDQNTGESILNALDAYYNLYKLEANQRLLEHDLAEQDRRLVDFKNLEKNGFLTRNDLLKVQLGASRVRINLLDAENAISIAKYNLKIMLNLSTDMDLALDTLSIFPERTVLSREDLLASGLDHRSDIQSLRLQTKSYQAGLGISKSGYYPSLSLSAGYLDAFVPGLITLRNVINGNIGLKYTITSLFTVRHQVQEAKAHLHAASLTLDLANDRVRMEINQNYLTYTETVKKIALGQEIIDQAAEAYKILKNKYANSLATLTDLLDSELSLLESQINQAGTRADAQIAYYRLIHAAGYPLTKQLLTQKTISQP